jgi:hypothetical protein
MKTDSFIDRVLKQESHILAIDFDGVIHKNSKGFHDGSVYDDPIEGAYESIEVLSKKYSIVIFSCKALTDRPLVDNKTGIQLIWEWLEFHGMSQFVDDVTFKKPRALFYIDDKGIRFTSWEQTMGFLNEK